MKPYGWKPGDSGCCPGHDKFPGETYENNRSKRAQTRDTAVQHRRGRRSDKQRLPSEVDASLQGDRPPFPMETPT